MSSSEKGVPTSRRDFLKQTGAVALGAGLLAATGPAGKAVAAPARLFASRGVGRPIDELYEISGDYRRFDQKWECFCRFVWDTQFAEDNERLFANIGKHLSEGTEGYDLLSQALEASSWTIANIWDNYAGWRSGNAGVYSWDVLGVTTSKPIGRIIKPPSMPAWRGTPDEAKQAVRKACKLAGAPLMGVCELDERWVYARYFNRFTQAEGDIIISDEDEKAGELEDGTLVIPSSYKYLIVYAMPCDYDSLATSPSLVAGASIAHGYSKMAYVSGTVAEFIRQLGYNALPMGNDTILSVPSAVAAGLGELGRNGLLITPEYGPRVRLGKILTDLPMTVDGARNFGVREFCSACKKCARECPSGAITDGEPTTQVPNESGNPGVMKWPVNGVECRRFWSDNGGTCSNCMAVCPYNKPEGYWHHTLANSVAPKAGTLFVQLDDLFGYGEPVPANDWWAGKD